MRSHEIVLFLLGSMCLFLASASKLVEGLQKVITEAGSILDRK